MKTLIKNIPIIGNLLRGAYRRWIRPPPPFLKSGDSWADRYDSGGNSGDGSYGKLAEFKAEVLNQFALQQSIRTVIEYGCGDGNQLRLARYPTYLGFDVSAKAVAVCKESFASDPTKSFKTLDQYQGETADLTLSLDVVYHLVEDSIYHDYMNRLFDSSTRFVVVYSSNTGANAAGQAAHVKHRHFTKWIDETKPGWKLVRKIPNRYPYNGDTKTGSFADFYIYEKDQP